MWCFLFWGHHHHNMIITGRTHTPLAVYSGTNCANPAYETLLTIPWKISPPPAQSTVSQRNNLHLHLYLCICICICIYVFIIVSHSLQEVSRRSRSRKGKDRPGSDPPQVPCRSAAKLQLLSSSLSSSLSFIIFHYLPHDSSQALTNDLVQLLSHAVLKAEIGGHIWQAQ